MNDVIIDFQERVEEIEEYLKLLTILSHAGVQIHINRKRPKKVSNVAIKTMKASCFLMLYNLVESSIRGSMAALYEQMNSAGKPLNGFDSNIKDIWIDQNFRNMEPFSTNQYSYRKLVRKMIESVLDSSSLMLDVKQIDISGNLDARAIRELFGKHKISTVTHYRALGGAELKTVKDQRNSLAHGDISFADCGQQYTVSDIDNIKKQTVTYLRSSLKNVVKYIDRNEYAV